jgi:hypothetical protein
VKILKAIGILVAAIVLLIAAVAIGARFSDGPVALLPGGPLTSGEWVEGGRIDWSFATDIEEIEFESGGRSRTTWILVHEGEAYIPCSLSFPPGKSWHQEILELVKVEDEALFASLAAIVETKYTAPPGGGEAWFFHIAPR